MLEKKHSLCNHDSISSIMKNIKKELLYTVQHSTMNVCVNRESSVRIIKMEENRR